jgi:phosphatidylglycerophosphate synthase
MKKEGLKNDVAEFDYRKSLKITATPGMNILKRVDIYLNRPVAALIVRVVFHTRVTPNGLTYVSFLLAMLAVFFFSRGEYLYFVLGGVFAQLSSIVDGADGMLARARETPSEYGAHLDLFFDRIIDFSLFLGVTTGAYIYYENIVLLMVGTLGAGLYMLQINLYYLTKRYLRITKKGETGELRAVLMWGILIFALVNRLDICIYLGFLETVIVNTVRFFYFIGLKKKERAAQRQG